LPTGPNAPTLALSPEDIDALVDRQVGVISDHQEAPMIDQSDIDALVKQLASATGAPDTKKISDALAKHEGEIDDLLGQAGDAKVTMDAIPMAALAASGSGAKTTAASATLAVPVMAPAELKGTRWLLAAAVLFLAVCAVTLGLVVQAIHGLSQELKVQHQAALVPSNSFADDYKAALAQLQAPDDGEVAKGVVFMSRLKARHPGHEAEIALALGRHFRAKGAYRQAAEEFAALAETGHGLFDDPRIFLDYAACLGELGDLPAASRQVYLLLANEDSYLAPRDRNGLTRPADEMARNQQAVQDAYLALGRMLANTSGHGGPATVSRPAGAGGR
jgi:tetratricopeptide (TPR) repeat protein